MKSTLLLGQDDVEFKEAFEKAFYFRKRLSEVLDKEIKSIVTSMCNEDHFKGDWSLIQADKVAQIKVYKKILGLLE